MRVNYSVVVLIFSLLIAVPAFAQSEHYAKGSVISADAFVTDKAGSQVRLAELLAQHPDELTVLFIFGGGDMGFGLTGNLWCPDSFEDTHILRTLVGKYQGKGVNFIAVAAAPVYHAQVLGDFPEGVFLDADANSAEFGKAQAAFVTSTLAAHDSGILPIEPYFDLRLRLLRMRTDALQSGEEWQGAFRAEGETQFYGVPAFWILSADGAVLADPLRGNIYHPHGAEVNINYTYTDIDVLLQDLLARQ